MSSEDRKLRDRLVTPLEEATRFVERDVYQPGAGENKEQPKATKPKAVPRRDRNPRGVFEKVPGSGEWWIRYTDCAGRYRREKAGTKGAAIDLYRKRKTEALAGKKLPEKLRQATVAFAEIARDALAYSKANKLSYRNDACRMQTLLSWFREHPLTPSRPRTSSDASVKRTGLRLQPIATVRCSH